MSLDDLGGEQTQEQITGLIRVATVKGHESDGRVRVTFPDRDDVTSQPLQVVELAGLDHTTPPIGTQVLVLMQPPEQTEGYVLGGLQRQGEAASTDPGVRIVRSEERRVGKECRL